MKGSKSILISNVVYSYNGRLFVKDEKNTFRGMYFWRGVKRLFGRIYITTGNEFYLDDYGFVKVE